MNVKDDTRADDRFGAASATAVRLGFDIASTGPTYGLVRTNWHEVVSPLRACRQRDFKRGRSCS